MASRHWSRVLGLLVFCGGQVGCGGVHDLGIGEPPRVVLRGHVDRFNLNVTPGARLLAALVWAVDSPRNVYCDTYRSLLGAACPDPADVAFASEPYVVRPVDANGDFALPVYGGGEAPSDTGSVIVMEDRTDPGYANYARRTPLPPPGFGIPGSGEDAEPLDPIVGASFSSVRTPQFRVMKLDSDKAPPWSPTEYPTPGCAAAPAGFSYLEIGGGICQRWSTDREVEVYPVSPPRARALSCRLRQGAYSAWPARDFEPRISAAEQSVCLTRDLFALIGPSVCRPMSVWALKGCDSGAGSIDPFCKTPEFDFSNNPPAWWPCH